MVGHFVNQVVVLTVDGLPKQIGQTFSRFKRSLKLKNVLIDNQNEAFNNVKEFLRAFVGY